MSKSKPWQKWPLPDQIDAPRICFKVPVPNDRQHIAAFLGAIQALASGYNWADDPSHKARKVARVWRNIADKLRQEDCSVNVLTIGGEVEDCMRLRIDPDNSCIIQCFDECAQTWGTFLDVTTCAPGATSQQPPGGTPSPGDMNCYSIKLDGNGKWFSPVPIKGGDTVQIIGASGGWTDGNTWFCPNGQDFILGGCAGSGSTSGSDPAPSIDHMRIIASLDAGATWQDAYNRTLTVPVSLSPTNLLLQANDDSLSDNAGSISLQVCINTENPATWTQDFDFLTSSGGWQPRTSHASWVAGTGWTAGSASSDGGLYIEFPLTTTDFIITRSQAILVTNAAHQSYQAAAIGWNGPTYYCQDNSIADSPGGTLNCTGLTEDGTGHTNAQIDAVTDPTATSRAWTSAHFEGTGTNPFV